MRARVFRRLRPRRCVGTLLYQRSAQTARVDGPPLTADHNTGGFNGGGARGHAPQDARGDEVTLSTKDFSVQFYFFVVLSLYVSPVHI